MRRAVRGRAKGGRGRVRGAWACTSGRGQARCSAGHKHLDALVLKLLPRLHIDRNRASHRLGVREDLQRLGSNLFGRPPAVIECDDWIEKAAWVEESVKKLCKGVAADRWYSYGFGAVVVETV